MGQSAVSELHTLLDATDGQIRILRAIRCPTSGEGIFPALESTEKALAALARTVHLPRAELWHKCCNDLLTKCDRLQETHTSFSFLRGDQAIPVFRNLACPPKCQVSEETHEELREILGRLIAAAASRDVGLNVVAVGAWATLLRFDNVRKTMHPDWSRVVSSIPVTREAIDAHLQGVTVLGLRTLLEELAVALDTPLSEPLSVAKRAPLRIAGEKTSADMLEEVRRDDGKKSAEDDEDSPHSPKDRNEEIEKLARVSPTGWLITQANFSRHTQKFGLSGDRDRLHPKTLQQVCKQLMRSFLEGDRETRDRVALAHISLTSGVPGKLAIHLPLQPVSYPYVDLAIGALYWNYRLALDSNAETLLPPRTDVEIIQIALDADVAEHMRMRLLEHPAAKTLCELFEVRAGDGPAEWLGAYRAFLSKHGDPAHPAYDARFSRSVGDVYRQVSGSDVVAAGICQ